jgi:hypothetical protein
MREIFELLKVNDSHEAINAEDPTPLVTGDFLLRDEFGDPLKMESGREADIFDSLILVLFCEAGDHGLTEEEIDDLLFSIVGNDPAQQPVRAHAYIAGYCAKTSSASMSARSTNSDA